MIRRLVVPALACLVLAFPAAAQPIPADQPDRTIDAATRARLLQASIDALEKSYVFPEVASRMAASLRDKAREYDAVDSAKAFARKLTQDLQEVSRDKHLRVVYSAQPLPSPGDVAAGPSAEQVARREAWLRSINFGFEKVERLQGNIGYLELRTFQGSGREAEQVADAAMTVLAHSAALIIDLRRNGGGSPHMVARVSSYLFDRPTHLNSLYWREGDRTEDFWTARELPGRRFGAAKPVFVLTSQRTFSGAEEFAYNLKNLKRATIVGETTGGGAHPGGMRRLDDHFSMFVPSGRAINPITKTNWEGTGVAPDVEVPADKALERAVELATKAIARPS